MKLLENSFVVSVAYGGVFCGFRPPRRTSLCPLFWRFLYGLLVRWPLGLIAAASLVAAASILFGFMGYRLGFLDSDPRGLDGPSVVPIATLPSVRGVRVSPFLVLLVGLSIWSAPYAAVLSWTGLQKLVLWLPGFVTFARFLVVVCCLILAWNRTKRHRGEIAQLVVARFKALKERTCPTIEIVASLDDKI